ncbi:hypothetical protein KKF34_15935 [Myxococcota bacterium]|nr:hypothetical protein [Myxococcota bacterium]MBU1380435.1 hypothetical protein [Myxococcota bacterium]MBU1498367.1 hypothetical protein [Myxococcota bacterium]
MNKVAVFSMLMVFITGCTTKIIWVKHSEVSKLSRTFESTTRGSVNNLGSSGSATVSLTTKSIVYIEKEDGKMIQLDGNYRAMRVVLVDGREFDVEFPVSASFKDNQFSIAGKNFPRRNFPSSNIKRIGIWDPKSPVTGFILGGAVIAILAVALLI